MRRQLVSILGVLILNVTLAVHLEKGEDEVQLE